MGRDYINSHDSSLSPWVSDPLSFHGHSSDSESFSHPLHRVGHCAQGQGAPGPSSSPTAWAGVGQWVSVKSGAAPAGQPGSTTFVFSPGGSQPSGRHGPRLSSSLGRPRPCWAQGLPSAVTGGWLVELGWTPWARHLKSRPVEEGMGSPLWPTPRANTHAAPCPPRTRRVSPDERLMGRSRDASPRVVLSGPG